MNDKFYNFTDSLFEGFAEEKVAPKKLNESLEQEDDMSDEEFAEAFGKALNEKRACKKCEDCEESYDEADEESSQEYFENARAFAASIEDMSDEEAMKYYYDDYGFDKNPPADEAEKLIADALKKKISLVECDLKESAIDAIFDKPVTALVLKLAKSNPDAIAKLLDSLKDQIGLSSEDAMKALEAGKTLYDLYKAAANKKNEDYNPFETDSSDEHIPADFEDRDLDDFADETKPIEKCEKCGRPLNDAGQCPFCDEGDEDIFEGAKEDAMKDFKAEFGSDEEEEEEPKEVPSAAEGELKALNAGAEDFQLPDGFDIDKLGADLPSYNMKKEGILFDFCSILNEEGEAFVRNKNLAEAIIRYIPVFRVTDSTGHRFAKIRKSDGSLKHPHPKSTGKLFNKGEVREVAIEVEPEDHWYRLYIK